MKYAHIIHAVTTTPWAILPVKLAAITEFLELVAAGGAVSTEVIKSEFSAARQGGTQHQQRTAVAVLPVFGVISHRMNMMQDISGGVSVEKLTNDIRELLSDDSVSAIVLQIDSPGGSVNGIKELTDEIYNARGIKPIIAVADSLAASAAYSIASAADEVVVTPSGSVGSIGVYCAHMDYSKMEDQVGRKTTLISAGKYKVEGNPFEPLSESARDALQQDVDEHYRMFVDSVARNRGASSEAVRNGYGEGRVLSAEKAVAAGLADRVATLDAVIAELIQPQSRERNRTLAASRLALKASG